MVFIIAGTWFLSCSPRGYKEWGFGFRFSKNEKGPIAFDLKKEMGEFDEHASFLIFPKERLLVGEEKSLANLGFSLGLNLVSRTLVDEIFIEGHQVGNVDDGEVAESR